MRNANDALAAAKRHGWEPIPVSVPHMLSWAREGARINYWPTTGTIATCINHPKRGKTQLFRRRCFGRELDAIFANPRVHTGKGYR